MSEVSEEYTEEEARKLLAEDLDLIGGQITLESNLIINHKDTPYWEFVWCPAGLITKCMDGSDKWAGIYVVIHESTSGIPSFLTRICLMEAKLR
jgi:hypothetical protein